MSNIPIPKSIKRIPETMVHVDKLQTDGRNPNHMTKEQMQALKNNIETHGFTVPIITDKNLVIADGEHRLKAAKELGLSEVPVKILNLTEVQRRILRQVMNKLKGTHDKDLDYEEYKFIYDQEEFETFKSLLPDIKEYEDILKANSPKFKDPDAIDVKKLADNPKYQISVGDVYQLGKNRVMCGDSTNEDHVKQLMNGQTGDMCFTDPPYGVSYTGAKTGNGKEWAMIKNDDLRTDALAEFLFKCFKNLHQVTKKNPALYSCYATVSHKEFEEALNKSGWLVKQVLIWDKGHVLGRSDYHWVHEPIMYCRKTEHNSEWYGDRTQKTILDKSKRVVEEDLYKMKKEDLVALFISIKESSDVITIRKDSATEYIHPTQKPVELPRRLIRNSTLLNENVIDLFGESGVTLIACEMTHRNAFVMELDPKYTSGIIERWELFTNEKAKKVK